MSRGTFAACALFAVWVATVITLLAHAKTPQEQAEMLCRIQGGVPGYYVTGEYARCDFPVRVDITK